MIRMQVAVALLIVGLTAPIAAQRSAANDGTDIQRLHDNAYLIERDLASLSQRDTARAEPFQARLQDLQEEIIYLKVKQRKEGSLQRREYADVRDGLEDLRADVLASLSPRQAQRLSVAPSVIEVPVGTEMDVRMTDSLDSGKAMVEDRFEATTVAHVQIGGRVAIPAGSVVRGVVTAVSPGTHTNRTARMTVSFDQVTVNGEAHPIRGTVTEAIQGSGVKGDIGRVGAGAGAGAVIGALLGGTKGAVLGATIGGGGTLAATEGKEVRVPQGTVLRVRLDSPVQMSASARN